LKSPVVKSSNYNIQTKMTDIDDHSFDVRKFAYTRNRRGGGKPSWKMDASFDADTGIDDAMETNFGDVVETEPGYFGKARQTEPGYQGNARQTPPCSIRIGGLPAFDKVSDSRLEALFEEFGEIREMVRKKETLAQNLTMAIVTYGSHAEAKAALDGLRKMEIVEGLRLSVRFWIQRPAGSFHQSTTTTNSATTTTTTTRMLSSVPDADQRALAEYEAKRESRRKALEARGVAAAEEEEEEECTECGQSASSCCRRAPPMESSSLLTPTPQPSPPVSSSSSCFTSSSSTSSSASSSASSSSALKDYLASMERGPDDDSSYPSFRPCFATPRSRIKVIR